MLERINDIKDMVELEINDWIAGSSRDDILQEVMDHQKGWDNWERRDSWKELLKLAEKDFKDPDEAYDVAHLVYEGLQEYAIRKAVCNMEKI